MSIVTATRRPVEIPTDSDGYLVPSLLPVAAYLCVEEYSDESRARVLERLADGVSPRDCARDGALEWRDLAEVERLLAGRRPYEAPLPPICGGEPSAEELAGLGWDELCAAHDAETAAAELECPPAPPEPYQPTEEDERWLLAQYEAPSDFPRAMGAAEYRDTLRVLVAEFTGR